MKYPRIISNDLCLGCGLCQSLFPDSCRMIENSDGFYRPVFNHPIDKTQDKLLSQFCPAIQIKGNAKSRTGDWGEIISVCEGWSADDDVRFHSASGGVTTSLAIYLLESNYVDAILQVGLSGEDYIHNKLRVSKTKEDILQCAQSRYAPALVFDDILQIINANPNKRYAFIGKPCDIATIRNLQRNFDCFKRQIKYCISIFCAGMPSYKATVKTWRMSGRMEQPHMLKYRGDGWPGFFTATWPDGYEYKINYNDSWGKVLGRSLGMRCKVCPDGIGQLADIAIGDAWVTKNGFPDFTEQPGRCFIMVRTESGMTLYKDAVANGSIVSQPLDINNISAMQPYQAKRRTLTLWRLIPLQLKTGFLLSFQKMGVVGLGIKANPAIAIRTLIGSFKRLKKHKTSE